MRERDSHIQVQNVVHERIEEWTLADDVAAVRAEQLTGKEHVRRARNDTMSERCTSIVADRLLELQR